MKARNKVMLIMIIIALAIALIGTIALGFKFMLDAARTAELYNSVLREQGEMLDELHTLDIEKARLEEQNIKLQSENKELKAALVAALTAPSAEEPEPVEEVNPLLPPTDIPTNTYRCEPYRIWDDEAQTYHSAFAKNSEQAALQEDCFTDIETGIRYYFDTSDDTKWHCAALAGAYGVEIGHCYIFTLANGTELPVMLSDFKHDITDPKPDDYGDNDTNYDGESCINVIEFVVDMGAVPQSVRDAGTMSKLDKFGGLYGHGGNIVDVKDAGRRWKA